jgi:DNA primase
MRVDIKDFDVIKYLDSRGISYKTHGDNVSRGWLGTQCIFCIDHSNHLGINLKSKVYSCLKCGEKGNGFKLIQEIDGCNFNQALQIVNEFNGGIYTPKEKHYQTKLQLPKNILPEFLKSHRDFLISRNYDPDYVINKYNLMATGLIGDFNHRIIIPITMNQRILSFVGRDITGKANIPYKNSPDTMCIKDPKRCLYNMDSVNDVAVVVEGIFDAWRIGDGAVATFGTQYTHEQLLYLKNLKRVFVLYDADAASKAEKLCADLSAIVKEVSVIVLDSGDPDNMSEQDVKHLRKEIEI